MLAQQREEEQRAIAEQQARRALTDAAAAKAIGFAQDKPERALLLSLEAHRLGSSTEVTRSLLTSMAASPEIAQYMRGHDDWVRSVAFAPDGSVVASAGLDGRIILRNARKYDPIAVLEMPAGESLGSVYSVAFSRDGSRLAAGLRDGRTIVFTFRRY